VTEIRTVLGDVSPDQLGICYAHEHLVIDGGIPGMINPEIALTDVDSAVAEVRACKDAGVRSMVDAMPADAGRNVLKLADISRRTGLHIVVATGLHHARYYGARHWSELLEPAELADLFVADIDDGVDAFDYNGPVVRRTPHRAGIIKVAGSDGGLSARDQRTFEAAALTATRTGVAVLTHCEGGRGGMEQIKLLEELGIPLERVALSHTDKVADRGYHRDLLGAGVCVVYDQGIRAPDLTAQLVEQMAEDGYAGQLLLGTDGARRSLWASLGGSPGLAALRTDLGYRLAAALGEDIMRRLWIDNPARLLALP
jgi:5-phospho-D-xylono-1,4-lactonase